MKTMCGLVVDGGSFCCDGQACERCGMAWDREEASHNLGCGIANLEPWKSVRFWRKANGRAVHYVLPEVECD